MKIPSLNDVASFATDAASSTLSNFAASTGATPFGARVDYMVIISRLGDGTPDYPPIQIVAYLPENFQFDFSSEWDAPFAEGVVDNAKLNQLMQLGGIKPATQAMTTQMWKGSSNIEMTLPLDFVAESHPAMDVRKPIMDLVSLSLPTTVGGPNGLFKSPGPTYDISKIKEQITGSVDQQLPSDQQQGIQAAAPSNTTALMKNTISLSIGSFIYLDNVVITNVSQNYKSLMHTSGIPMSAQVSVTFRTVQTPTANDIRRAFGVGGGGALSSMIDSATSSVQGAF